MCQSDLKENIETSFMGLSGKLIFTKRWIDQFLNKSMII